MSPKKFVIIGASMLLLALGISVAMYYAVQTELNTDGREVPDLPGN